MKINTIQEGLNKVRILGSVVLLAFFLLGGSVHAEGWITGEESVVYKGIRYVANVDTLEFYDAVTDKKIDEVQLYDRNEDAKNNPQDYPNDEWEVVAEVKKPVKEVEGENGEDDGEDDDEDDGEDDGEGEDDQEEPQPELKWERIGYLMARDNQLTAVTNLGNEYKMDLVTKTVVKKTFEDVEKEDMEDQGKEK
ncbi:MAG: hypothetical protein HQL21_08470 [Candidatus Omnitrophica bacterium]|nr:hypothetical protein [Candidatus Omnitrophota bacterium]